MKWLDKLKYHLFNCRTSKYIDNDITLFIGDLNNEKYLKQLLIIINQFIQVNYNNNLEIALSLIQLLNDQYIHQFIKELNELNTAFPDLKSKIYFKRQIYVKDWFGNTDTCMMIDAVLDIISTDEYFLSKMITFFNTSFNETYESYKDFDGIILIAELCRETYIIDQTNEFLKSIGIDINKLV